MGSTPYERMYVRTYVCSSFVITLATSFIIQFRYNFTQVLGMTIPPTNSSRFSVIGSRSRPLRKICHHCSALFIDQF